VMGMGGGGAWLGGGFGFGYEKSPAWDQVGLLGLAVRSVV
jgi:hypothetical protein